MASGGKVSYDCNSCSFRTDRLSKLERHYRTEKHRRHTYTWAKGNKKFLGEINSFNNGDHSNFPAHDGDPSDHEVENQLFEIRIGDCDEKAHVPVPTISDEQQWLGLENGIYDDDLEFEEDSSLSCSDSDECISSASLENTPYFPFPSKTVFLLCTLMYSGTHNVSDKTMQYILYILKELGVLNVPSLKKLKSFRFMDWESMISKNTDGYGVPFSYIKVSSWLSQCLAHPTTSTALIRYSRQNENGLCEQADGSHWRHYIPSPWACENGNHYRSGQFVKFGNQVGRIENFFQRVWANADNQKPVFMIDVAGRQHMMVTLEKFQFVPRKQSIVWIQNSTFEVLLSDCEPFICNAQNIIYKQSLGGQLTLLTEEEKLKLRFTGTSEPSVSMPVNLFFDDTSANKSRRWNPIHAVQGQLSGLPLLHRDRRENVAFLSASVQVDILSIAEAILQEINELKRNPMISFDAKTQGMSVILPDVGCLCLDGAMLSEVTHHLGPSANRLCAVCKVHVDDCLKAGCPKTSEWLKDVMQEVKAATSVKQKKAIQSENGVKLLEGNASLIEHMDVFRSVTYGSLHWYYLGIARSLVKEVIDKLSVDQKSSMEVFLKSVDQSSFPHRISSQTTLKYFQSRQGKDFKVLVQLMPFVGCYIGVQPAMLNCLINLAHIARFVEAKSLTNAELGEFERLLERHVQMVEDNLPGLRRKQKTHSSFHVISDVKRHGPMPVYKEDNFEKKHGDIRRKLFHQNQHCRSRDTAFAFAADMCLQHIVTGGFFQFGEKWVQAGHAVRYPGEPVLQFVTGRPQNKESSIQLSRLLKPTKEGGLPDSVPLLQSFIDWKLEIYPGCPTVKTVKRFLSVLCMSNEVAKAGNFVLYQDSSKQDAVGKVVGGVSIVEECGRKTDWVEVEACSFSKTSEELQCPVVKLCSEAYMYIPCQSVRQVVCLIHCCKEGNCDLQQQNIHHNNYPFYFVNIFRLNHPAGLFKV